MNEMPAFNLPKSNGLAFLDASKCQATDDPEYPIVYTNENGVTFRLHRTRVIHVEETGETREEVV